MGKSSFISSFEKIPRGFVAFLCFALVFEGLIYIIPKHRFAKAPYEHVSMKLKADVIEKKNAYDIIIIGDCAGWAGIRTLTLEKNLNLSAYNLCGIAYQTYMVYYVILKRYLEHCAKQPKLVILQISPVSLLWERGMDFSDLRYNVLPYLHIKPDIADELGDDMRFTLLRYRLANTIPSIRYQYILQGNAWFITAFRPNKEEYERYVKLYTDEKGFYKEEIDPRKQKVENITDIGDNYKKFAVSEYNMRYIKKMLKMLEEKRIPTAVCITSVRNDEMNIWAKYGVHGKMLETLRSAVNGYDNVVGLWDMTAVASGKQYFIDGAHLNSEGAEVFTKDLAERIKRTQTI